MDKDPGGSALVDNDQEDNDQEDSDQEDNDPGGIEDQGDQGDQEVVDPLENQVENQQKEAFHNKRDLSAW